MFTHCEHFSYFHFQSPHGELSLINNLRTTNSETLDRVCLFSLTPRMGKSVQAKVRCGRSIYQKTAVSSAHSRLGGRISPSPSAKVAQRHLVNQSQNRAVGAGWVPSVLAAGWD